MKPTPVLHTEWSDFTAVSQHVVTVTQSFVTMSQYVIGMSQWLIRANTAALLGIRLTDKCYP